MTIYFLRLSEVRQRLGLARGTLYHKINKGLLTPPIKYGQRTSLWPEYEIDAISQAMLRGAEPVEIQSLVHSMMEQRKAEGRDGTSVRALSQS